MANNSNNSKNSNNNEKSAKRIFTIAGRRGTVIVTDSRENPETNNCPLYVYKGAEDDTQILTLKALNKFLSIVPRPRKAKFQTPVFFVLPKSISFLNYMDTREYWVTNKCKKNGDVIEEDLLNEVAIMHKQVKELGDNIMLFGQYGLKDPQLRGFADTTWRALDGIVPPNADKVDANKAF